MPDVTMGPATVNIAGIRAGDRNLFTMTIKENGVAVNLTGMTIEAQVRSKATDLTAPALTAVITVVDAAAGKISMRFPGTDVATLLAGAATWAGVWDMQLKAAGEDPVTICQGTFGAVLDVTR